MSDRLIPITDEQAKLGQEALKTLRGLGSFLEQALGSTPEDLIGYLGGDWLRVRRAENIATMFHRAKARLVERGVEDPHPASLSVAIPILQGAADEDREELVDLWARLLANAMDPNLGTIRYSFIDAVKALDPPDAMLLQFLHQEGIGRIDDSDGVGGLQQIASHLNSRRDEVEVSARHLLEIGFVSPPPSGDANVWYPNATLREFMRACYPELHGE
jgi:hypothetical protein